MDFPIRQSTSTVVPLGFFLSSTDGNTEQTALTLANTDLWVWKAGATSLVSKNSGGATHMQNGVYYATLDTTDTNTVGPFAIYIHKSGSLVCVFRGIVIRQAIYDALYGSSAAYLPVDVEQWKATTAADLLTVAGIRDGILDTASSGHVTAGTVGYFIANSNVKTVDGEAATQQTVPTAADVAASVLDGAASAHNTAGTIGEAINDAAIASTTPPTVSEITSAILNENAAAHNTAGTIGALFTSTLTNVNLVKAVTDVISTMISNGVFTSEAVANAKDGVDSNIVLIKAVTDTLSAMVESGAFKATVYANMPTSSGGSTSPTAVITTIGPVKDAFGDLLVGADIIVTNDNVGQSYAYGGQAGDNGCLILPMEPGTYYAWISKYGKLVSGPHTIVVTGV